MSKYIQCPQCETNWIAEDESLCTTCKNPSIKSGGTSGGFKGTITEKMVEAAYKYGKEYSNRRMTIAEATAAVVRETSMNKVSAQDYVFDIDCLFGGRRYSRTMSADATIWILKAIKSEFGEGSFQKALDAVEKHLGYYESLESGGSQTAIRSFVQANKTKREDK